MSPVIREENNLMFNVPRCNIILDCLGVRIGEQRGAERFICGIIAELASRHNEDYLLLVNKSCVGFVKALLPRSRYLVIPIAGKNRVCRMLVQMIAGPLIARRYGASLYASTSVFPTLGFPCPTCAVLHDLMLYHFPKEYHRLVWWFRTSLLKVSIPTLSAVFTVSQTSADDIKTRFSKGVRAVHIVPNGADPRVAPLVSRDREQAILQELALQDRKFAISVLGGGHYKNQRGLAEAAAKLLEWGRDDIDIIVVGDAIKVFRAIPHVRSLRPLGFVTDEVLTVLYNNAKALIYPTLFEGFGLPVIEAQAAGVPVICSDIAVLREIGGRGAVFVEPHSAESIAEAIVAVLDSPELQGRLIELGKENAALFTWQHAAERFLAACRAVMSEAGAEQPLPTSV